MSIPRIVVVGGGAGGLELVTRLGDRLGRKGRADITLVERARTHFWKPHLHELAAGTMDLDVHELDYLAQSHWHGYGVAFPRSALERPRILTSHRRIIRSLQRILWHLHFEDLTDLQASWEHFPMSARVD